MHINFANLQEVFAQLNANYFVLIFQIIVALVIILLLKLISEGVVAYILFRADEHVKIKTPVEVYGKRGRIKCANWSLIVIRTECGHLRIPMREWRNSRYIVLDEDDTILRDRRKGDRDKRKNLEHQTELNV